jgi:hypothetical protein
MLNDLQLKLMAVLADKTNENHVKAVVYAVYKTVAANKSITESKLKWTLEKQFKIDTESVDAALVLLKNRDYANAIKPWSTVHATHLNANVEFEPALEKMVEENPELAFFIPPSLTKNKNRKQSNETVQSANGT